MRRDYPDCTPIRSVGFIDETSGVTEKQARQQIPCVSGASNPSDLKDYETNKSAKPANGVTMQGRNSAIPLDFYPTDGSARDSDFL